MLNIGTSYVCRITFMQTSDEHGSLSLILSPNCETDSTPCVNNERKILSLSNYTM